MEENELLAYAKLYSWHMRSSDRKLDIYDDFVVDSDDVVLKNVQNDDIKLFKGIGKKSKLDKLMDKRRKLENEIARIDDEIKAILENTKEKNDNISKSDRHLNFKSGVKQRISSIKSKFGNVKNSILRKLSFSNINAKLRNAFDKIKIFGLSTVNKGVSATNKVKDSISDFTSDQIANYYIRKSKNQEKEEERQRKERLRESDEIIDMEIKARTEDHKQGMIEAFNEQDNDVQKQIASEVKEIMENSEEDIEDRKLNFKSDDKPKASSKKSKLGWVKNSILRNLNFSNIGVKIRNAFDKAKIFGLSVVDKGVGAINKTKEGIVNLTSKQIAKYSEWRVNRQAEKEHQQRVKESDKMIQKEIKENTKEHKRGMIDALNDDEREKLDAEHIKMLEEQKELINKIIANKNKLFNKNTSDNSEVNEDSNVKKNHR